MRNLIIVSIAALAAVVALSPAVLGQAAGGANQGQGDRTPRPSIAPPTGWNSCPRCQNNEDRRQARTTYKVEGHPFDPHDLSGVWGYNGVGGDRGPTFRTPPALTPWGKERREATFGEKNAKGEVVRSKDTSGLGGGSEINCDPMGYPRLYAYNYGFEFMMHSDRVLQFFELNHTWRTIWTDGRKLPDNPPEPH